MKLLASLRSLLAPAGIPLVVLGPGGDFTEHVFERAGRLTVERPVAHTMQEIETDADPFPAQAEHITARSRRHRLSRFLSEAAEEIPVLDVSPRTAPVITINENQSNESHPQAVANLRIHPSAPRAQGVALCRSLKTLNCRAILRIVSYTTMVLFRCHCSSR